MFLLETVREFDREQRWNPTFQMIQLDTRELVDGKTQNSAKQPKNRNRNRYRDVLPYDDTRVILKNGINDYINANVIEVPEINRKYILGQGPLENTCNDFWTMIWENNSTAVIMLCRIVEKQMIKCHPYWPMGEDEIVEFGNFQIENERCELEEHYIIRHLSLKNNVTGESRKLRQFHFMTWPDFGVPENARSFVDFLNSIRDWNGFDVNSPPIIHCSAGIGRSGTLILVDAALKLCEKNNSPNGLDIRKLLLSLRQQRVGLVQTAQQYRFAWLAILSGIHGMFPEIFKASKTEEAVQEGDEDVPPPLPEKNHPMSSVPPEKPPRTNSRTDTQETDFELYHKLTELSDEEDSDEEEVYIDLSDASDKDSRTDLQQEEGAEDLIAPRSSNEKARVYSESSNNTFDNNSSVGNVTTEQSTSNPPSITQEIGSKAREQDIRMRQRQKKREDTQKLITTIKQNMKDSEQKKYSRVWVYAGIFTAISTAVYIGWRWWS